MSEDVGGMTGLDRDTIGKGWSEVRGVFTS